MEKDNQFVEAYNNKAKTCAIYLRPIRRDRLLDTTFNIEIELSKLDSFSIFPFSTDRGKYVLIRINKVVAGCFISKKESPQLINCLEIEHGKSKIIDHNISCLGSIVAICNGLILISSAFTSPRMINNNVSGVLTLDRGQLVIINPMTRKFLGLPLGTPAIDPFSESYGLVFSHLEGVYKVVHLFKYELGHIACEVWSTDTRYWRTIDGLSENLSQFSQIPIWASGALHWLLMRHYHHPVDYIVSMRVVDERFFVTNLPMLLSVNDELLEMGGVLILVRSVDMGNIEVWMLKGLGGGSEWIKQHTIQIDVVVGDVYYEEYFTPVFAVNGKEMIFKRRPKLYSYNFEAEEMTEIEMDGLYIGIYETLMPFTCSLAMWERLEPML